MSKVIESLSAEIQRRADIIASDAVRKHLSSADAILRQYSTSPVDGLYRRDGELVTLNYAWDRIWLHVQQAMAERACEELITNLLDVAQHRELKP